MPLQNLPLPRMQPARSQRWILHTTGAQNNAQATTKQKYVKHKQSGSNVHFQFKVEPQICVSGTEQPPYSVTNWHNFGHNLYFPETVEKYRQTLAYMHKTCSTECFWGFCPYYKRTASNNQDWGEDLIWDHIHFEFPAQPFGTWFYWATGSSWYPTQFCLQCSIKITDPECH